MNHFVRKRNFMTSLPRCDEFWGLSRIVRFFLKAIQESLQAETR